MKEIKEIDNIYITRKRQEATQSRLAQLRERQTR